MGMTIQDFVDSVATKAGVDGGKRRVSGSLAGMSVDQTIVDPFDAPARRSTAPPQQE
jgi:hypothetical protein